MMEGGSICIIWQARWILHVFFFFLLLSISLSLPPTAIFAWYKKPDIDKLLLFLKDIDRLIREEAMDGWTPSSV